MWLISFILSYPFSILSNTKISLCVHQVKWYRIDCNTTFVLTHLWCVLISTCKFLSKYTGRPPVCSEFEAQFSCSTIERPLLLVCSHPGRDESSQDINTSDYPPEWLCTDLHIMIYGTLGISIAFSVLYEHYMNPPLMLK